MGTTVFEWRRMDVSMPPRDYTMVIRYLDEGLSYICSAVYNGESFRLCGVDGKQDVTLDAVTHWTHIDNVEPT